MPSVHAHGSEEPVLHMIVNTHNPESCAFRGQDEGALLKGAFDRLAGHDGTDGDEIAVRGSWVNRAAHEIFVLVDAPNAHVIEEAVLDAGLIGRTHTRVLPVTETKQVEVDTGRRQ